MELPIADRAAAGKALAERLREYRRRNDTIVLGLPRGGVPVAFEVAQALQVPLDILVVRKLGLPANEELAMGAIASGELQVLNWDILDFYPVTQADMARVVTQERQELQRRETAYRGQRPRPGLRHKRVILVDDGLATGATMRVAIKAVRQQDPAEVVVAVPVAPDSTAQSLLNSPGEALADEVITLATPEPFLGVGRWYRIFDQTSDDEVRHLLAQAWQQLQPA